MSSVPAASALEPSPIKAIPLRTPFSSIQELNLKNKARLRSGQGPYQRGYSPPTNPPANSDQTNGVEQTPGASKAFFPPNTAREGTFCSGYIPSDMAVAASISYVVQVTNSCITVLNPASGVPFSGFPKALCSFFGVSCNDSVGDPRALYDPKNARFIIIAEDFSANNLLIAATTTANPTTTYDVHSVGMGIACGGGGDFPMAGQTLNEIGDFTGALYVSWDEFCPNGSITNDEIAFSKMQVYSTSGLTIYGFINISVNGILMDHVQPVNVMNYGDRPRAEFLVATYDFGFGGGECVSGCNGLWVFAFYNTISGSAVFSGASAGTAHNYFLAPNAPQPGCTSGSCLINTPPPGITGTVNYSSGQIYPTITTGGGFTGAGVLFWQVHPTLNDADQVTSVSILNEICLCGFTDSGSAYYPTVQPDSEGNFTMVYNFSDPSAVYPSTSYLTQRVTQATGSFHDSGFFVARGSGFYEQLDNFGRNRWGDYTGTAWSQTFPNAYWFSGEYSTASGGSGLWNTAIGKNGYTSLSQP
jgi:hypothetical protein